jgi:hypothetical protein
VASEFYELIGKAVETSLGKVESCRSVEDKTPDVMALEVAAAEQDLTPPQDATPP